MHLTHATMAAILPDSLGMRLANARVLAADSTDQWQGVANDLTRDRQPVDPADCDVLPEQFEICGTIEHLNGLDTRLAA